MTAVNFPRSFDVRYEIAAHECQTIRFAEKSLKLRIAGRQPEVAEGENAMLSDIYPIQSANRSVKLAAWFSCPPPRQSKEDVLPCRPITTKSPSSTERAAMAHNFAINDDVHHQLQGPQGRAVIKQPSVYTIVTCLPIEADGRPRYRIKSKTENIERVVTEEQISRLS
jgi:hypothetical protein